MPPTHEVDRVSVLLQTHLFQDLSPAELEPLGRAARPRALVRGEYVCRVGDPADALYVVVAGRLKDSVDTEDGEEVVYTLYGPGAIIGEPGFFAPERSRIMGVVALEPTTILVLERADVLPFMQRHPPAMLRMLERLAMMERAATEIMVALARRPLAERLLLRLLTLAEPVEPQPTASESPDGDARSAATGPREAMTPKVSQADLAAMVGSSREHVNRALARLASEGTIRIEGTRYVITDPERTRGEVFPGWPLRMAPRRRTEPESPPPSP